MCDEHLQCQSACTNMPNLWKHTPNILETYLGIEEENVSLVHFHLVSRN